MSDVIDFLERMGQDAQLRERSQGDVELALADTQIDPALCAAILARDPAKLQTLLGSGPIVTVLMPAEEEEEEGEGEDDEGHSPQEEEQQALRSDSRVITAVV